MKTIILLSFLFITSSYSLLNANCLVERVIDGDTFICGGKKVRIAEIDAPEKKQLFGVESKIYLEKIINDQVVALKNEKTDSYKRTLATVIFQGEDIGQKMVKNGLAWHYMKYSQNEVLKAEQRAAQNRKINLWREENPTPPWEFRKTEKMN